MKAMTKVLLLCSLMLSMVAGVANADQPAKSVHGDDAAALYMALVQALRDEGYNQPPTPGISLIRASSVACSEGWSPQGPVYNCVVNPPTQPPLQPSN